MYTNICRSLFERHKLLFGFLLTIRILQGDNLIDPTEWLFLISGKALTSVTLANPAPDWIDGRMWAEFTALATLPTFAGLAQVNLYILLQPRPCSSLPLLQLLLEHSLNIHTLLTHSL